MTKKLVLILLSLCMVLPCLASCSRPPEYSEIRGRLEELVAASYEINDIFFGEGLAVYEHVTDPKASTSVYEVKEIGEGGVETTRKVWFYYTLDDNHRVIAHRDSYIKPFSYALRSSEKMSAEQLMAIFPADEGASTEGLYVEIYASDEDHVYCYSIPYTEKKYDMYYSDSDPADYDYVRFDEKYQSIDAIKDAAEKVYSSDYLSLIYQSMFIGTVDIENTSSLPTLSARYFEMSDDSGNMLLLKSNTYEPLIKEKRIYNFDTAKFVKKSNKKFLTIELDSYLESEPQNVTRVKINMRLQNGTWYLDNLTH